MAEEAENNGRRIFENCCQKIREDFEAFKDTTGDQIHQAIEGVGDSMKTDYRVVIIDPKIQELTSQQISIRKKFHKTIMKTKLDLQIDKLFKLE